MSAFNFEIKIPTRLFFGVGSLERLGKFAGDLGKKAMIVTGRHSSKRTGLLYRVEEILKKAGVESVVFDKVTPNPTDELVDEGSKMAKEEDADFIIGLGGGSSIDCAKAIAMTTSSGGKFWDYVSVGGGKKPKSALPIVAITTTHGTGTEIDPFAVITNLKTKEKVGIGYDVIFPKFSIVDPELMLTLPKDQTLYTSMDAFYHAIETFISVHASVFTDMLALDAMRRVVTYLPLAYENGDDLNARTNLAWANTEAGITLTLAGASANHAIEHGITGFHPDIAHGLGLCMTGPNFLEHIKDHIVEKLAIVGKEVFGVYEREKEKASELAIMKLREFQGIFKLNRKLRECGVKDEELEDIAKVSYRAMYRVVENTPGNLKESDLLEILKKSF